jgi:hypothetical protein
MKRIAGLLLLLFVSQAYAEYKLSPFTGKFDYYETGSKWQLAYSTTVATSVSSITVSGLNGNAAKIYRIEAYLQNDDAAECYYFAYFNAKTEDYIGTALTLDNMGLPVGDTAPVYIPLGRNYSANASATLADMTIYAEYTGTQSRLMRGSFSTNSVFIVPATYAFMYIAEDNITSITFFAHTLVEGTLGTDMNLSAGSWVRVWKLIN